MHRTYILTAFGKDRPGIISDVTELLYEHGYNLEDTTMTRLLDEFAMILLFSGENDKKEENLTKACRRLEIEKEISAFFRPMEKEPHRMQEVSYSVKKIQIEGIDHAGIIFNISRYCATFGVNIINLSSKVEPSAESGTAVYCIDMEIQVPKTLDHEKFLDGLNRVCDELNVNISIL